MLKLNNDFLFLSDNFATSSRSRTALNLFSGYVAGLIHALLFLSIKTLAGFV